MPAGAEALADHDNPVAVAGIGPPGSSARLLHPPRKQPCG
jgi:hypothetical protein